MQEQPIGPAVPQSVSDAICEDCGQEGAAYYGGGAWAEVTLCDACAIAGEWAERCVSCGTVFDEELDDGYCRTCLAAERSRTP